MFPSVPSEEKEERETISEFIFLHEWKKRKGDRSICEFTVPFSSPQHLLFCPQKNELNANALHRSGRHQLLLFSISLSFFFSVVYLWLCLSMSLLCDRIWFLWKECRGVNEGLHLFFSFLLFWWSFFGQEQSDSNWDSKSQIRDILSRPEIDLLFESWQTVHWTSFFFQGSPTSRWPMHVRKWDATLWR